MGIAIGADLGAGSQGIDVEAFAALGSKVDKIHDHMMKGPPKPVIKTVSGGLTVPATPALPQLLTVNQFPAIGRMWNILKLGVFGADLHTAIASVNVDVYAGTLPDSMVPPALPQGVVSMSVPQTVNFARLVEWCEEGEQLFALLYGAGVVAGVNFTLIARVAEYNVFDVEAGYVP